MYHDWAYVCTLMLTIYHIQVLLSKDYARYRGYQSMEQAVVGFRASAKTE